MAPFLRKVKTASRATAVQVVVKEGRRNRILEHVGSAHTDAELAALMEAGRAKIHARQGELDLELEADPSQAVVQSQSSRLLVDVIASTWNVLGFDHVADEAFFQLVVARLVEPTSMLDSARVLAELGIEPVHRSTMKRCLARIQQHDYRDQIASKCFDHARTSGDITLVMYDVTTLYFEAEKEDDLRKVGYSKERRVDPQIVVGLLVDRQGFPLEIGCFEGNRAETKTIVPIIEQFRDRHNLADMVVVADAGMLSAKNLTDLEDADFRFIVGSRVSKAPHDLAHHFHWHGDAFTDGQMIETITPGHGNSKSPSTIKRRRQPVWDPQQHAGFWRAVWHFSRKRAVHDAKTLTHQENRARAIIAGDQQVRGARFVKTTASGRTLDEAGIELSRSLVGLKGYVTNIPAGTMPAAEVLASYHDLWRVEQSFRMSKTDLRARPMFHRDRDAIDLSWTFLVTHASSHLEGLEDGAGIVGELGRRRDVLASQGDGHVL